MMVETLTTSDTTKEVGHPKGAVRVKNPGVQTGVDAQDRSEPTLLKIEGDTTADQVQPSADASQGKGRVSDTVWRGIDRSFRAGIGRFTGGISPVGLSEAYFDWLGHLWMSPGKQAQLVEKAWRKAHRLGLYWIHCVSASNPLPCIEPLPQDDRFLAKEWRQWPYKLIYQSFLLHQQWWHNATTGIEGVDKHHERVVEFVTRQLLDIASPSNIPWLNPEVTAATIEQGGLNLIRGIHSFREDWLRLVEGKPPVGAEQFKVGVNVAITPGKVVYRNRLMELIQYSPTTEDVYAEPVLIVPAWIMKYYILDLSPNNSLVRYLVERGHTVFIISWKNPVETDRDLGMDAYHELGTIAALNAIDVICGHRKTHAVGYCLGGTLSAITAAAMERNGVDRLASITLLATLLDFTEPGELGLFISESEVAFLESMTWEQGYLDTHQMVGAFQLLRSNDLIWSRMLRTYLLGRRPPMNDLMAWNADATRLPYRMHSEYLRRLYLDNDLASGRYKVGNHTIFLTDIRIPIFAVGTEKDHVAPWRSVFKIHHLTDTDITFVLTSGGHNAGIVSEPGHKNRSFQMATKNTADRDIDPATWRNIAPCFEGSWWPAWQSWLARHSTGRIAPPTLGNTAAGLVPIADAPGIYVLER